MIEDVIALDALKRGRESLESSSVDSPRQTAEIILSELLGVKPSDIYLQPDMVLDTHRFHTYLAMVERRKKGEPLAHIVGNAEFMGLKLIVSRGVFIPRPETEVLCEILLDRLTVRSAPVAADICTGCGAIAIALAGLLPGLTCYGTDISRRALEVARLNAQRIGVSDRTLFIRGHLTEPLKPLQLAGRLDCLVANPPYVKEREIEFLPTEVRVHEPLAALHGGVGGLDFYRPIAEEAAFLLMPGGTVAFEVGDGCAVDVAEMLTALEFCNIDTYDDLQGAARFVIGFKKESADR